MLAVQAQPENTKQSLLEKAAFESIQDQYGPCECEGCYQLAEKMARIIEDRLAQKFQSAALNHTAETESAILSLWSQIIAKE